MSDYYSFTTEYGNADELFKAVLSLDKARVEQLKANGVTLTENVKQTLVNGGGSMMSNKPASPFWYLYISDLENVGKEDFVYISRTFFEEAGKTPLYYSDALRGAILRLFSDADVFACIMECYDQKKINKKQAMQFFIRKNSVELLEICARYGWLKQASKRDEMIEYANKQKKTECAAWLLDYKNRTADLKAEQAKAEKKAARELNAKPDSALELGKLWSWKKGEDGGLIITSYKGDETEITIPAKIGNNIVTAIGDYALSPIAPKLKEQYAARRTCIKKITVPNGIRTVGECAFGGSGTNSQWRSATSLLEEVVLPDTLDIFTDRKAAETAPKMFDYYGDEVAIVPNCENAVFYCIKNNIRYRFAGSDEVHIPKNEVIKSDALFSAILDSDREKVAELKNGGASFTEHIKGCLANAQEKESIWRHGILSDVRDEFTQRVIAAEDGDRRFILNAVKEELGVPLQYDDHIRYMFGKAITPELFDCVLEYYDNKRINRADKMQEFIKHDKLEFLAVCAKHGWLKNTVTRDKLIQYASEKHKTEATAWLLDFKNRTADLAAERKRAEKRLERQLNAPPPAEEELRVKRDKLFERIFTYEITDGEVIITGYKGGTNIANEVEIPREFDGKPVVALGERAFYPHATGVPTRHRKNRESVTKVALPDTLREIGEMAFLGCVKIKEIAVPGSVTKIGSRAFFTNPSVASTTIIVERGSFAEEYCKKYGERFTYKE